MSLERRKCISYDEDFDTNEDKEVRKHKPTRFSNYSMEGCILECRAKYAIENCGCLPYYYPDFSPDSGVIDFNPDDDWFTCNLTKLECLSNISGINYCYTTSSKL